METGYLAAYRASDDLCRGIQLILTDDELRAPFSRHCREVVFAEYTWELQARRFKSRYEELLAGGGSDAAGNSKLTNS